MKKIFVATLITLAVLSCKKEKEGNEENEQKVSLLTEVRQDGKLLMKFQYNPDQSMSRLEGYTDNTLDGYIIFTRNEAGDIVELKSLSASEVPVERVTFSYDAEGRLISGAAYALQGPDPTTPQTTFTFEADAQGRINKRTMKDEDGALKEEIRFKYDESGNLIEKQDMVRHGGLWKTTRRVTLSAPKDNRKAPLEELQYLLGADLLIETYRPTINVKMFDLSFQLTMHTNVNNMEEYNEDGTVKRHTVTIKYVTPSQADYVTQRDFVYSQQ